MSTLDAAHRWLKALTQDESESVRHALGCRDIRKCPHMRSTLGDADGDYYRCFRCDAAYYRRFGDNEVRP